MEQGSHLTVLTQLPLQSLSRAFPNGRKWAEFTQRGHFAPYSKVFTSVQAVPERVTLLAFKISKAGELLKTH